MDASNCYFCNEFARSGKKDAADAESDKAESEPEKRKSKRGKDDDLQCWANYVRV